MQARFGLITEIYYFCYILDVIQAYKGIQKEKDALEASLKALTETKNSTVCSAEELGSEISSENSLLSSDDDSQVH